MSSPATRRIGLLLLVFVLVFVSGCENTVTPFSGRAQYSVYGALALHRQDQWVRVKALRDPVLADSAQPLGASATITNLSSGRTTALQDSIFQFEGSTYAHNYWGELEVEPQTRYELTVTGPAGTTKTETLTPTDTDAIIEPSRSTPGPPTDTVRQRSDTLHCLSSLKVTFRDAKFPYEASIGIPYEGSTIWIEKDHELSQDAEKPQSIGFVPEYVLAEVYDGTNDFDTCQYFEPRCGKLSTGRFLVSYTYLSPETFGNRPPPGGRFDPRSAGTVEGGLGFFGAYRRDTVSVTVHRGVIDQGICNCTPGPCP